VNGGLLDVHLCACQQAGVDFMFAAKSDAAMVLTELGKLSAFFKGQMEVGERFPHEWNRCGMKNVSKVTHFTLLF
jgi:hypothetical protein